MSVIGNILWFVFAGFWQGVSWCLVGLLWCITIVGIPVGTQCFKMAGLAFFPFGKEVEYGAARVGRPQRAVVHLRRRVLGARGAAQRRAAVHHDYRPSPSACSASSRRSWRCCPSARWCAGSRRCERAAPALRLLLEQHEQLFLVAGLRFLVRCAAGASSPCSSR